MTKVIVIIPAYNEEKSIEKIIKTVLQNKNISECVVINDASTDNTLAIAKSTGATVITNGENVGTGLSTKIGLKYANDRKADFVVLMDADGQHNPLSIQNLLDHVETADVVIGSRYFAPTSSSTSYIRKLGTKIISISLFIQYGTRIFDPTSGFRVFNKRTIQEMAANYPIIFSEPEVIIDLLLKKRSIREVSIEMSPRLYGKSSINLMKALNLMVYILLKIAFQ